MIRFLRKGDTVVVHYMGRPVRQRLSMRAPEETRTPSRVRRELVGEATKRPASPEDLT